MENEGERVERSDRLEILFSGIIEQPETTRDPNLALHVFEIGRSLISTDMSDKKTIARLIADIETARQYQDSEIMTPSNKDSVRRFDIGYEAALFDMATTAMTSVRALCSNDVGADAEPSHAPSTLDEHALLVTRTLLRASDADAPTIQQLIRIMTVVSSYENSEVLLNSFDESVEKFNFGYCAALRDSLSAAITQVLANAERQRKYQERDRIRSLILELSFVYEPVSTKLLQFEISHLEPVAVDDIAKALADLLMEGKMEKTAPPPGSNRRSSFYRKV